MTYSRPFTQSRSRLALDAASRSRPTSLPAVMPAVSFDGTGLAGGTETYTWDNANSRPNPNIGFLDYPRSGFIAYGPNYPQYLIASSAA